MKIQRGTNCVLQVSEVLSRLLIKATGARALHKVIPLGKIISLSLFCILSGCSRKSAAPPEVVRPVKTIVLTSGGELQSRTFSGRAQASQEAELTFQTSGRLVRFPVREGQRVARGDLIAQLRQEEFETRKRTLQSQLEQGRIALRTLQAGVRPEERLKLEASARAAEARLTNATAQHERFSELIKSQAVSRAEFEAMETSYRIAQEDVEAAQQKLKLSATGRTEDVEAQEAGIRGLEEQVREAQIQLQDSTIRAPFDGVIAQRFVEQNQNISPQQPIARLQNADEMDVAVDVPESIMGSGLTADRIVKIIAEFTAAPGVRFPVSVREMAQVADPVTQTFRIRGSMKARPGAAVLPGMTAAVTLTYRRGAEFDNRLLVPISAVCKQESSGKQVVWVVGEDQIVKSRPVRIGEANDGQVEVVDGLRSGERIAVAGVSFLREGMEVRDLGSALGDGRP
jgi:RND family efflux transporter MFP subunit